MRSWIVERGVWPSASCQPELRLSPPLSGLDVLLHAHTCLPSYAQHLSSPPILVCVFTPCPHAPLNPSLSDVSPLGACRCRVLQPLPSLSVFVCPHMLHVPLTATPPPHVCAFSLRVCRYRVPQPCTSTWLDLTSRCVRGLLERGNNEGTSNNHVGRWGRQATGQVMGSTVTQDMAGVAAAEGGTSVAHSGSPQATQGNMSHVMSHIMSHIRWSACLWQCWLAHVRR